MTHTLPTPAQWQASGSHYTHHGHQIFYQRQGSTSQPPIVCIHGFPTASYDWAYLWPHLGNQYHLVAPDMIGFGYSAKPYRYKYSILDQADLVEGLVAQLGLGPVHVLAHDYGDTVAQELLARALAGSPNCLTIKTLCFLNGGLFPEVHHPRPIQRLLISPIGFLISRLLSQAQFNKSFSAVFGPNTQPTQQELEGWWQQVTYNNGHRLYHKLIAYLAERKKYRARWAGALQQRKIPMRFINGPEDPVSGKDMANYYEQQVPNADVVRLPGIGHYPQTEAPQQVAEAYLPFVNGQQPKR